MRSLLFLLSTPLVVAACGDNVSTPATLGGTIQGLRGASGLVLANHGDVLEVAADGSFTFPTPIALGATYDISIVSQPTSPHQTCALHGAKGTVDEPGAAISVSVTCKTNSYRVAGTVVGLDGKGLALQNNAGDDIAIAANGAFMFSRAVASGEDFVVSVKSQPSGRSQTCSVAGGDGTIGGADVTSVLVNCATDAFAVGGTIAGLEGTLVLQNNAGDDITVSANGSFAFPRTIASGDAYAITVHAQPATPSQTCVVAHGTGKVTSAAVDTIAITCTTNRFAVGGTVTGLAGTGLALKSKAGEQIAVTQDGSFTFPTTIESGELFEVTVAAQPENVSQTCTVSGGAGVVGGANIGTVVVNCATNRYAVGGAVTGLAGTLKLLNNAGDEIAVTTNGQFAFPTTIDSGADYAVTVAAQPTAPWQTCHVDHGEGTVTNAAIGSISITCATNRYAIEGTVSGLANGNTLVIHNGAAMTSVPGNGAFAFDVSFDSGSSYFITVDEPTSPVAQSCTVANNSGIVGGDNVSDVAITCTTKQFTVGGTVTGLVDGTSVVLTNNGENITVDANRAFTFSTLVDSGAKYSVTVATQPQGLSCVVTNGFGKIADDHVSNVAVTCGASITRWTDGTYAWPDQACNPYSSFGSCDTNDQAFADVWATFVCKQNGYSTGTWTGNKQAGCSGAISMYCSPYGDNWETYDPSAQCNTPQWETYCQESDQTRVEITCTP